MTSAKKHSYAMIAQSWALADCGSLADKCASECSSVPGPDNQQFLQEANQHGLLISHLNRTWSGPGGCPGARRGSRGRARIISSSL